SGTAMQNELAGGRSGRMTDSTPAARRPAEEGTSAADLPADVVGPKRLAVCKKLKRPASTGGARLVQFQPVPPMIVNKSQLTKENS
ncbi:MAG TPA: hypothetical protein VLZ89_02435, partial [Anaerolineales bacterium]|nr:hypothetical protein [Anaerolineales bacterium]